MAELKLAKLPDRTPVKLAITITPDLQGALREYAAIYAAAYGCEAFLESDRAFVRAREAAQRGRA